MLFSGLLEDEICLSPKLDVGHYLLSLNEVPSFWLAILNLFPLLAGLKWKVAERDMRQRRLNLFTYYRQGFFLRPSAMFEYQEAVEEKLNRTQQNGRHSNAEKLSPLLLLVVKLLAPELEITSQ